MSFPNQTSTMDEAAIARARIKRRSMQRSARALAEQQYEASPILRRHEDNLKKRQRNRSAFISRQAARHYERLLVEHLEQEERDRDEFVADIERRSTENQAIRAVLSRVESTLSLLPASTPKNNAFVLNNEMSSPQSVMSLDYEVFARPPHARPFGFSSAAPTISPLFGNPFDNLSYQQ